MSLNIVVEDVDRCCKVIPEVVKPRRGHTVESALGWTLVCCSMIFNNFGAAEVEQQGLHFPKSGTLERPELDSGLLFNDFH